MSNRQDAIDDANARVKNGDSVVDAINTTVIDHQLNDSQIAQVTYNVTKDNYSDDAAVVAFDDLLSE